MAQKCRQCNKICLTHSDKTIIAGKDKEGYILFHKSCVIDVETKVIKKENAN